MMPQEPNRTSRFEARFAPEALAVVRRAAEMQGRSVSDFIVAAAQEAAHRTIEETHLIRLSADDQQRFVWGATIILAGVTTIMMAGGEGSKAA